MLSAQQALLVLLLLFPLEIYRNRGSVKSIVLGGRDMAQLLKSTGCSSREPRFDSLHPHRGSQLSVTLVPGNLIPSSELCGHQAGMLYTDVHARQTPIHIKSDKFTFFQKIESIMLSKFTQ